MYSAFNLRKKFYVTDKNQEFYNFLLDHKEARKDLVRLLVDDLYNGLHRADE